MCGIAGRFNFLSGAPVEPGEVSRMARAIAHRGPDDEGIYCNGPIGLGFRRLSIIDLEGGHQPMEDQERTVQVVFNGEIYNFRELRDLLSKAGHVFRTNSDTEVIVHGYKEWGTGVFDRLNGMFGIAVWDSLARELVLARDAAGIKPVYYRIDQGGVSFGSEVRALRAGSGPIASISIEAVRQFLQYRYTPAPLTVFSGVEKLAPGTMAVFRAGHSKVVRWHNRFPDPFGQFISDEEATEELLRLYKAAMERHLVSDVPVGLLLSGGIDSGLLLGLMHLYGRDWPTFTVGFGTAAYRDDELADASRTASIFNSINVATILDQRKFEESLAHVVSVVEEPVASASIVPMYLVCERARADVKVALSGQGPDELFGGYTRHLGIRYGSIWRGAPNWLRQAITTTVNALPRNESLKRGVASLGVSNQLERFQQVFSLCREPVIESLFRSEFAPSGSDDLVRDQWSTLLPEMSGRDELAAFQTIEIRSSLPDELLLYSDKLSMAHGLEVRVPYLDKSIVEFASRLPARMKIRLGRRKWLHRKVCEGFLPREILRRKKRGFAVDVVDRWFGSVMKGRIADYFRDPQSRIFEFIEMGKVAELLKEHESGRNDNHKLLFSLVVLEHWLRCQHKPSFA